MIDRIGVRCSVCRSAMRSDEAGRRQEYDHDGVALLELVDRHHDGAVFARARQRGDAV